MKDIDHDWSPLDPSPKSWSLGALKYGWGQIAIRNKARAEAGLPLLSEEEIPLAHRPEPEKKKGKKK